MSIRRKVLRAFGTLLLSLLTAEAFLKCQSPISPGLLVTFVWIGFLGFYRFYANIKEKLPSLPRLCWLLAAVFGAFSVAGHVFLGGMPRIWWKVLVAWVGFTPFFFVLLHLLYWVLQKDIPVQRWIPLRLKSLFSRHTFAFTFVFLLVCWLVPILLKYPAGICWDASWQIDQGMGNTTLTSHHPVFHSMLMAWFTQFGLLVGSANLGIFLFVVVEALVIALIVSYGIQLLVRLHAAPWTILLALLFFGFSPFVTGYVGTVIKDVYFTAFSLLFTILIAEYALCRENFWKHLYKPLLLIGAAVGMVLFRNNGIYVIVPSLIVLLILECRKRGKGLLLRLVAIALGLVMPILAAKAVDSIFQPEKGSLAEALSLPFQQTARFVTYYGDLVTEEEREIIDQILPYEDLPQLYNPYISDPVKGQYNRQADTEDLIAYLKVWIAQFFRKPTCYIASVWEQNVILLYPEYNNYVYYLDSNSDHYPYANGGYFETPAFLQEVQEDYQSFLSLLHTAPFLSLLNNMAVYVMVFLALVFFSLGGKDFRHLTYYIPVLLALFVIVLAPCIRWHVRYAFPIIYALPLLLGFYTTHQKRRLNPHG